QAKVRAAQEAKAKAVAAAAAARAAVAGVVAATRRSSKPDDGAAVAAVAAFAAATDALETSGASSRSSENGVSAACGPQPQGGGSSRGVSRGARGPSRAAGLAVGMGRKMPPGELARRVFPGKAPAVPNTLNRLAERSKGVTPTTLAEKFWIALPRASTWRLAPEATPGMAATAAAARPQQQRRQQGLERQQQRQQQQQQRVGMLRLPQEQRANPAAAAAAAAAATSRPMQLLDPRPPPPPPPPCASSRRTSPCPPQQQLSSAAYSSRRSKQAPRPPPFRPLPFAPEPPTSSLRSVAAAAAAAISSSCETPRQPAAFHRTRGRESTVSLGPSWVAEVGRGSDAGERWMLSPADKDGGATTPAAADAASSSPPPCEAAASPSEVAADAAAATPCESREDAATEDGRNMEAPPAAAAAAGSATTSESEEAAADDSAAAAATEDCQMTKASATSDVQASEAEGVETLAADGVETPAAEGNGAVPACDDEDEDDGSVGGGGGETLRAEGPNSDGGETLLAERPTSARDGSLPSSLSKSSCAPPFVCGGSPSKGKRPRVGEEGEGEGEEGTPTRKIPDYSTCVVRHMHVLQCFLCRQYPRQPKDGRAVVFCLKCPRKACLRCQETKVSKDRTGWVPGRDTFGRYYEIPECRECHKGSDDEVPAWVEPPWMEGEGREISEGDTRRLLDKFLHWLQKHELAHFFADETVKRPMNFTRMRERLGAGEYESRRAGLNSFMEDVDWMRHNCIKFNG
ncbi:unnamed protein product, partial [Ectocarpus fasciculatus]